MDHLDTRTLLVIQTLVFYLAQDDIIAMTDTDKTQKHTIHMATIYNTMIWTLLHARLTCNVTNFSAFTVNTFYTPIPPKSIIRYSHVSYINSSCRFSQTQNYSFPSATDFKFNCFSKYHQLIYHPHGHARLLNWMWVAKDWSQCRSFRSPPSYKSRNFSNQQ